MTLSNLDLYQYDAGSNTQQAASTSAIDNVEQVRGTGSGQVIYKVKDQSSRVDGASAEPFALAATNQVTPLAAPVPTLSLAVDRPRVRQGEAVTLTATLTNASPDLAASGATVALQPPAGVRATAGGLDWSPGALPAGATLTHSWTLEGDQDSAAAVTATASATAYGETFTSTDSARFTVDSSPPTLSVACGHAAAADPQIALAWSGTDESPIAGYQLGVSTDGGSFVPWQTDTGGGSATFAGLAGHSYDFEVTGSDALGNTSAPTRCGPVAVGFAPVAPVLPSGQTTRALPAPPHLKIRSVRFRGSRLLVRGVLDRRASGPVIGAYLPRRAPRAHARARTARGRYTLTFRLTRSQLRARRGVVRLSYAGDGAHAPQRLSRSIARGGRTRSVAHRG